MVIRRRIHNKLPTVQVQEPYVAWPTCHWSCQLSTMKMPAPWLYSFWTQVKSSWLLLRAGVNGLTSALARCFSKTDSSQGCLHLQKKTGNGVRYHFRPENTSSQDSEQLSNLQNRRQYASIVSQNWYPYISTYAILLDQVKQCLAPLSLLCIFKASECQVKVIWRCSLYNGKLGT